MTVYVVVDNEVHDKETYAEYVKAIAPSVVEFGGRYLVRGGKVLASDSSWQPQRLVMIAFADIAAANAWLDAPHLQQLHAQRRSAALSRMVVIEGVSSPEG